MDTLKKLDRALSFQLGMVMDSDVKGYLLEEEALRTNAVVKISREVISLHKLVLDAVESQSIHGDQNSNPFMLLENKNDQESN